ncbi:MAG: hypothetical protein LBH55_02350, partial [Mycoplasmataceae bacterium]|nr:hypothetical protein [Mycoplasmataceae bacterium]
KTQKRTISYDEILALTNDIEIACYQTNEFVKDSSKYDDQKNLLKKYIAKIENEKVVKIINLRLEGYDWNHIAYIVKINVTACHKMYAKFIEDTKQNIARTARRKFLLN